MSTDAISEERPYCLSPNIFACERDGDVVLLDLAHNEYLGLTGPLAIHVGALVADWPVAPERARDLENPSSEVADTIKTLVTAGRIVSCCQSSMSSRESLPMASAEVCIAYEDEPPRIGTQDIVRFVRATTVAADRKSVV